MADTVTELLEGKIKKASDESGSFENYGIKDAIEAEKYEKSKALANPFSGCAKARAIAAGPVQ
jgi:hypothetical protein